MKNFLQILAFFLFTFFFLGQKLEAQQRFRAGLVFGPTASQIRGDESAGYNKLGLHGGIRAVTVLKDKMDFVLEMLYSQRGSYARFPAGDMKINLRYVEVPLMISYKDWYQEEEDFYKVQVIGGFTYSRLLDASAIGSLHDNEVENFHSNDYGITLGADFFLNQHFAFGARWNRSLNLLYNNQKHNENLDGLVGYFLSFRAMYLF